MNRWKLGGTGNHSDVIRTCFVEAQVTSTYLALCTLKKRGRGGVHVGSKGRELGRGRDAEQSRCRRLTADGELSSWRFSDTIEQPQPAEFIECAV